MSQVKNFVKRLFSRAPPHKALLTIEILGLIFSHIDDIETLRSCSETCSLWRASTLPFLFHTITTYIPGRQREWPKPLMEVYRLSQPPGPPHPPSQKDMDDSRLRFVKRLYIHVDIRASKFTLEQLNEPNLRYFSALKNLQELRIDFLQLSSFIPNLKHCFGHLAPKLQSLTLINPTASSKQLQYFVGHFQKLQDLKLLSFTAEKGGASSKLVPPFQPPLEGWLTLEHCDGKEFVGREIPCGKPRFRYVHLWNVEHTQAILEACKETLDRKSVV